MTDEEIETTRKTDLKASLGRMDDVELGLCATQRGIDPRKFTKRDDLIAAIELQAEDEANSAASKKKIEQDEADQAKSIASEEDQRTGTAKIIRALNAEFCRDLPHEARSGSGFEPEEGHPRFGGEFDVPNGRYRVSGSDWLFDIKGKRLAGVERATEQNKFGGKKVIAVD